MKTCGWLILSAIFIAAPVLARTQGPQRAELSADEVDKLRETQDPAERIKLYVQFAQRRLGMFENFASRPPDPVYDVGDFLNKVLDQYIKLDDEMKDWIQGQYDQNGDMREGLRVLLDEGPKQLEVLRHARENPGPYFAQYRDSLNDAIADLQDTLDGASQALSGQIKKLGELKANDKLVQKQSKEAIKQEKKQIKQEKKEQKKEQKHPPKAETDQD